MTMLEIEQNTVVYEHFPKHHVLWKKLFVEQVKKLADAHGFSFVLRETGFHHISAAFFVKGKPAVFSERQKTDLHGKFFGDFH